MSSLSAPDAADASQFHKVQNTCPSSVVGISSQPGIEMRQFTAVLAQLKQENMASLASSIRQGNERSDNKSSSSSSKAPWHGCKVLPKPLYGSYNLAYRVLFDDGVKWILKVPVSGHHACFDRSSADALTSEALTMRMIKKRTTIPIPAVHHFDASAENEIGCPYILMDFLEGKPLWLGWFDEKSSRSSLERFRARALQSIATAMVQLSQFTVDRSGSLRFNSDGEPVDVAAARVPDWLAEHDIMKGLKTPGEGCLYCEKGPITDPESSFLFMLNRRGIREEDESHVQGVNEVLRLLTQWTLKKVDSSIDHQPPFVLAHPDFALQNFLVKDDGTLCGVIDWDGVAAVPLSVGCLRYPDWLMRDWHPEYDYWARKTERQENSPGELTVYRSMYAQFIELISSIACESTETGKQNANVTRISLVAGSLDLGAHDLKLTAATVNTMFEKVEALTTDYDGSASDTESLSDNETHRVNADEEGSRELTAPTDTEDRTSDKQENIAECLVPRFIAEIAPDQALANDEDEKPDGDRPPSRHTTSYAEQVLVKEDNLTPTVNGTHSEELAQDQKTPASRNARVAKWALGLGEKGSKRIVKALHKQDANELQPSRTVRVVKWALDFGGECCKGVSEVFHKEGTSNPGSGDRSQAVPVNSDSQPVLKTMKTATGLRKRTKTLLGDVSTRERRDGIVNGESSELKRKEATRIQVFIKWLIAMLQRLIQKPARSDKCGAQTTRPTSRRSTADLVDAEHCQRCQVGDKNRADKTPDMAVCSTKAGPEAVWAAISADVDKGGVPLDMIQKRREVITQCIIQYLGQELQREKDMESHLKNKRAAESEKKAEEQAEKTYKNNASEKESGAGLETEKTDTGLRSTNSHIQTVGNLISKDHEEPESTKSCRGKVASIHSGSIPTSSTENGVSIAEQVVLAKTDTSAKDLEDTKSASRKLRATLSKLHEPEIVNTQLQPNIFSVAENGDGRCENDERSQELKFTPLLEGSSERMAAHSVTNLQGGRWFETPGGNLKRMESRETLHDSFSNDERTSKRQSHVLEDKRRLAHSPIANRGDDGTDGVLDGQLVLPNQQKSEAVHVFQVPDIDENDDEASSSFQNKPNTGSKEPAIKIILEPGVKNEPQAREMVDSGSFTALQVCRALGNGDLEEQRMRRLRKGFMALLDDAMGRYRRCI